MNRDPSSIVGRVVATGVFLAGLGVMAMRGNDNEGPKTMAPTAATAAPFEDLTSATDAPTSSIAPELVHNPFLPTPEEIAAFDCLDPENEQYGITISEYEGVQFVEPILSGQIPIERGAHNALRREDGDSTDAPATVDPENREAFHAELSARLCGRPAVLAETIHKLVNSPLYLELVGEDDSPLAPYRLMTPDEVSAAITNRYNAKDITPEQAAENMATTKVREGLSEYVIAVLSSSIVGNRTDLALHSPYALNPESNLMPDEPVTFLQADYTGNAFFYDVSALSREKGEDEDGCPEEGDIFGYNTGATTNGEWDYGDLRIVITQGEDDCEGTPETTIPGTTPTTLRPKIPVTPTGGTAVDTTIETSNPGPNYPTTSNATTTTGVTPTSSTVYRGPTNSQPQTPQTSTTRPSGY